MDRFDNCLAVISKFYLRISQLLLLCLVLGVLSEVIMRYFFGKGVLGSSELTRLTITWIVFLMSFVLFRKRRHIVVTALVDIMAPPLQRLCEKIINVSVIILSIYVLVQIGNVWEFLALKTPVFQIPDTLFKISPAFCFVPMSLQAMLNLFLPEHKPSQPVSADEGF
tara:strand:- start:47517 stop:48017 length:501 start_codon:yes stop_codon:yes gene_type:complete